MSKLNPYMNNKHSTIISEPNSDYTEKTFRDLDLMSFHGNIVDNSSNFIEKNDEWSYDLENETTFQQKASNMFSKLKSFVTTPKVAQRSIRLKTQTPSKPKDLETTLSIRNEPTLNINVQESQKNLLEQERLRQQAEQIQKQDAKYKQVRYEIDELQKNRHDLDNKKKYA